MLVSIFASFPKESKTFVSVICEAVSANAFLPNILNKKEVSLFEVVILVSTGLSIEEGGITGGVASGTGVGVSVGEIFWGETILLIISVAPLNVF